MNARPIIFQDDMVRAILDGRKTQTRRVISARPNKRPNDWTPDCPTLDANGEWVWTAEHGEPEQVRFACPYGQLSDLLWVRESHYVWSAGYTDGSGKHIDYRATEPDSPCGGWTPSIHMPRWASRLTLHVTGVRVERLHEISEEDAIAEGPPGLSFPAPPGSHWVTDDGRRRAFRRLWESINGPDAWTANPWVWVIEFEPIRANVDQVLEAAE